MVVVPWIKQLRQNLPQTHVFAVSKSWQRWKGMIWEPYGILLEKNILKIVFNVLLDSKLHVLDSNFKTSWITGHWNYNNGKIKLLLINSIYCFIFLTGTNGENILSNSIWHIL